MDLLTMAPGLLGPSSDEGDDDDDNDGVIDAIDVCPQTPIGDQVGIQGCSITQLDDDLDGVSNADDMCLNSLPGRLVDGSGCAILNQADESVSNEADQNGLTTWLFVFAGVLLLAAGIVASNGRALPKTEANVTPPKRPVDLEEATDLDAPSNEQE